MPDLRSDEKEQLINSLIGMAFWINQSKKQELFDSNFDLKNDWFKKTKKILSIWVALILISLFSWINRI